jgi:hypothetical protein
MRLELNLDFKKHLSEDNFFFGVAYAPTARGPASTTPTGSRTPTGCLTREPCSTVDQGVVEIEEEHIHCRS